MNLDGHRPGGCGALAAAMTEHHKALHGAVGDLTKLVDELAPKVIGMETVALDANGTASRQFRVPFQSLFVDSQSAHVLTVAGMPLQTSAPNMGPGIAYIRIGGAAVCNIRSYNWSIWGGAAGELVTVTVFSRPQPPWCK
jgi:hypothetical protein